jgi:hypothetical protein
VFIALDIGDRRVHFQCHRASDGRLYVASDCGALRESMSAQCVIRYAESIYDNEVRIRNGQPGPPPFLESWRNPCADRPDRVHSAKVPGIILYILNARHRKWP